MKIRTPSAFSASPEQLDQPLLPLELVEQPAHPAELLGLHGVVEEVGAAAHDHRRRLRRGAFAERREAGVDQLLRQLVELGDPRGALPLHFGAGLRQRAADGDVGEIVGGLRQRRWR